MKEMNHTTLTVEEEKKIQKVIFDIYDKYNESTKKKVKGFYFNIGASMIIIEKVINIMKNEPSVLKIDTNTENSKLIIVGDIHGDLSSLISIFRKEGNPSTTRYLFLGDYVDRGQNSSEVITLLYGYKCLYPENIYLIRGNHEFADMNNEYGFKYESETKDHMGYYFFNKIITTYKYLPISAIINNKIFCVHGGISGLVKNREHLMKVRKVGDELTFINKIQTDFLWNDPSIEITDYEPSARGLGSIFGKSALLEFLKNNEFLFLIRGHQNMMDGFEWNFGEDCGILTVFSTINYCETGNDAAYATILSNNEICCKKFEIISDEDFSIKNDISEKKYNNIEKLYMNFECFTNHVIAE